MSFAASHRPPLFAGFFACLIAVFIGFVTPSTALAEDPEEQAQRLFAEGSEHFQDGDYLEAAETFHEILDLLETPPPELLYNIGQAYYRADELAEAERFLQKYLSEADSPPNEDEVAEMIIDIQEERAARAARKANLNITSEPSGARISIDGNIKCDATPCEIDLAPDTYELEASLDDHEPASKSVELEPRGEKQATLTLEEKVFVGHLDVRTDVADTTIQIADREHSLPLDESIELQPGEYTLNLTHDDGVITHDIEIERDETMTLFVPVDAASGDGALSTFRATAIGLGGASVALASAATITGMQARSTHESLQNQQDSLGYVDNDLIASGQRQQRASNMLWIGAFTTLGAGIGLWTLDRFRSGGGDDEQALEPTEADEDTDVDLVEEEDTPDIEVLD